MEYKGGAELAGAEFALMQIIEENKPVSGYEISKLIEERGYRHWTDIGTTSIYVGLEKLNRKGLASAYLDTDKKGKGPAPKKYRLTDHGRRALIDAILAALACSRERDRRFDLGMAGMPLVPAADVIKALKSRLKLLEETKVRIRQTYDKQGGQSLPLHVKALFEHPIFLIGNEMDFTRSLIAHTRDKRS